jgi:hypothetical protein
MYKSFYIAFRLPVGCNELYVAKPLTSLRNLDDFLFGRFRGDVGDLTVVVDALKYSTLFPDLLFGADCWP